MKKFFSLFVAALFSVTMFADTWTVAGAPASVFGSEWAPANTDNDMTLVDGLYTLVKEGVTVAAGNVSFKVVKNHAWGTEYPSSNYNLAIAEDGQYDITITFNESTHDVNATATKKGAVVIEKHPLVVAEAGAVNGAAWQNDNADNLMISTDGGLTYHLSIANLTLTAKTYEFKIVEQGSWTAYYDNGAGGNATFTISETAIYTLEYVFTVASSTCVVTATKTGEAGAIEVKYYLVGSAKGWDAAEANVFSENPGNAGEFQISTTLAVGEGIKVLKVEGVSKTYFPEGTDNEYVVDADHAGAKTIYFNPDKGTGWTLLEGYIWIDANEPTAISNTAVEGKAQKSIENGMLIIRRDGKSYNVLGTVIK